VSANYHTFDQLQSLGDQIRELAIKIAAGKETTNVMQMIQRDHAGDPQLDASGHVAPDPVITQDMITAYAQNEYNDIPQLFTAFSTPDPSGAQPTIDMLWRVAYALDQSVITNAVQNPAGTATTLSDPVPAGAWHPHTSIGTRVDDIISSRLKYWAGPASDSFGNNYLRPLAATVGPQSALAAELAVSLTAYQNLRDAMHADIWQIGQETLTVLDSVAGSHPHEAIVVLTVCTAAVSVLLAVPTDGWSFAGAFGLYKAVQGFTGTTKNVSTTIGGKTVAAVISSMMSAIVTMSANIEAQQQDVISFLNKVGSQITSKDLTVPQPDMITGLVKGGHLQQQFHPFT
jgi:hypothetical protein